MNSKISILPMIVGEGQPPFVERIFGEPLFFTESEILALQFAPDDSLWAIEESGIARQWDVSGKLIQRFFLSELETLWAMNRQTTVAVSGSDEMKLWDLGTGRLIHAFEPGPWITGFAFSPSGSFLASGHDDGKLRLWDVANLKLLAEVDAHSNAISALAFRDEGTLATAAEDHQICLWTVPGLQQQQSLIGHVDRIPALCFAPKDNLLVSAGWDTTARVWEIGKNDPLILLNSHSEQVHAATFAPQSNLLACADSDFTIHVWNDVRSAKTSHVFTGHADEIRCLTFNSTGKRLASGGVDRVIHIWDVEEGRLIAGADPVSRNLVTLAESADRSLLFSSAGSVLQAWDLQTGNSLQIQDHSLPVRSIAVSADGSALAVSNSTPDSQIIQLADTAQIQKLNHTKGPILDLVFSPDSHALATASVTDGLVWLWKQGEAEAVLVIPEAADACTLETIAFHPGGEQIAVGGLDIMGTGGSDGAICLWDLVSRERIDAIPIGVTALNYDYQGKYLAGGSIQNQVCVWDLSNLELVTVLKGHHDRITTVVFSADGSKLYSSSSDGTIRVWNWADNQLLLARQFESSVDSIVISKDGTKLYAGLGNHTTLEINLQRFMND